MTWRRTESKPPIYRQEQLTCAGVFPRRFRIGGCAIKLSGGRRYPAARGLPASAGRWNPQGDPPMADRDVYHWWASHQCHTDDKRSLREDRGRLSERAPTIRERHRAGEDGHTLERLVSLADAVVGVFEGVEGRLVIEDEYHLVDVVSMEGAAGFVHHHLGTAAHGEAAYAGAHGRKGD